MKNKVKYIFCAAVTLLITGAIIFLPYFYYSAEDGRTEKSVKTESFSLEKTSADSSIESLNELLFSGKAIWTDNKKNITEAETLESVKISLNELKKYFSPDSDVVGYIDRVLNDKNISLLGTDFSIVSGMTDDKLVSASLLYAEFMGEGFENMQILIDKETNKVYELLIAETYGYDAVGNYDYAENDKEITDALCKYIGTDNCSNLIAQQLPMGFRYSVFGCDYYSLRYNSADSFASISEN